jgi:hypothetical protein
LANVWPWGETIFSTNMTNETTDSNNTSTRSYHITNGLNMTENIEITAINATEIEVENSTIINLHIRKAPPATTTTTTTTLSPVKEVTNSKTNETIDVSTTTITSNEIQTNVTTSTTTPLVFRNMQSYRIKYISNLQPNTDKPSECVQYSSDELYLLLQSVGGVNQKFMANTPRDAAEHFGDILPSEEITQPADDSPQLNGIMTPVFY